MHYAGNAILVYKKSPIRQYSLDLSPVKISGCQTTALHIYSPVPPEGLATQTVTPLHNELITLMN